MTANTNSELDDIGAYVATFNEEESRELAAASVAMDVHILMQRARTRRERSKVAIRLKQSTATVPSERVIHYLQELGYTVHTRGMDGHEGEVIIGVAYAERNAAPGIRTATKRSRLRRAQPSTRRSTRTSGRTLIPV